MRVSSDIDPSHRDYLAGRPGLHRGYDRSSRYLHMRDGAKIAIDVCLPRGLSPGARIPTIVRQTRYFRRFKVAPALRPFLSEPVLDPMNASMRRLFTSRGYAWVDVDARGSGASFGERPCPWWLEGEVADGAEIVSWIVAQPWSNGLVGSTGVSYEGTTAEFLAITGHPAVKAIAPRFSLFDVYTDVAFPGGLHSATFTSAWETANAALDRNAPGEMVGLMMALRVHGMADARVAEAGTWLHRASAIVERPAAQAKLRSLFDWALRGVAPVDADRDERDLEEALRSHAKNYNTHDGATSVTFRDDAPKVSPIPGQTSDAFSPHAYVDRLVSAGTAVLGYGGFIDGGYGGAAVKRHRALAGTGRSSLLLGPWGHGGELDLDPSGTSAARFDHAIELLRFFDRHLATSAIPRRAEDLPAVRYFMMGEGRWRSAAAWPPAGTRSLTLHLGEGRKLARRVATGQDRHQVDRSTGAGKRSRWRTLLCPWLHADGRGRSPRGWLVYESDPLDDDLAIVGNPVLELALASSTTDGAVIVYLEEVDGAGEARLFTEGELRLIHGTRLEEDATGVPQVAASFRRDDRVRAPAGEMLIHAIELLPTAMKVSRGRRLRLVLGGADVDHFTTPPADGPVTWTIDRARSRLILPVALESDRPRC